MRGGNVLARRGLLSAVLVSLVMTLPLVAVRAASAAPAAGPNSRVSGTQIRAVTPRSPQPPRLPRRFPRGPRPSPETIFNHPPNTPDASSMSTSDPTSACVNSQAAEPTVNVSSLFGIKLVVTPTDRDNDRVAVSTEFWRDGDSAPLASDTGATLNSGTPVLAHLLIGTGLSDGVDYRWRARVRDFDFGGHAKGISRWSAWCWLTQDGARPSSPGVTSSDYPSTEYAGGPGQPGRFTFLPGASADTDITGYRYGIDQPSPGTAVATGAGGATGLSATVTAAPPSDGPHDMFVQAVDRAGNVSDPTDYHFFVNG